VNIGLSAFALAMLFGGKGGPLHAVENGKTIIQTILVMVFDGINPSGFQIGGLVCGIVGVLTIVLQKEKKET